MSDRISYLNQNATSPMFSKLEQNLRESKQARAKGAQWTAMIQALTQKGVKGIEIEESTILPWLAARQDEVITREDLCRTLNSMMFTVKEVDLGNPKYSSWAHKTGGQYHEFLYIANSERDNVIDELERVEDQMQNLVFEPERLIDEPELVFNLERERTRLIEAKGKSIDFTQHHFSDRVSGRLGKNLLAHCRVIMNPDKGLYFIEEIQSDWAQHGRKSNWGPGFPKGPLVTSTEAWAGMVLRRQLQIAAMNPKFETVAWITESMRNGGRQNLGDEERKRQAKAAFDARVTELVADSARRLGLPEDATKEQKMEATRLARESAVKQANREGLEEPYDMLNDFYLKVVPKLVDKGLSGTGVKVEFKEILIAGHPSKVPSITLNDAARARLADKQPLYSRSQFTPAPHSPDSAQVLAAIQRAGVMLGNPKQFRAALNIYDIATGQRVAGRYVNRLVQVSLRSAEFAEVVDHECFHYAEDVLLDQREIRVVHDAFAPGSRLNAQVREILTQRGDYALATQCIQPTEAAAQGFALWNAGKLDVREESPPSHGIFGDIVEGVKVVWSWIRREVLDHKLQTVEEVFTALAVGDLAQRGAQTSAVRDGLTQGARPTAAPAQAEEALDTFAPDDDLDRRERSRPVLG